MTNVFPFLLIFLVFFAFWFTPSFLVALVFTRFARRVAQAANLTAPVRPDRLHREVRPYGGGLAIAATLAVFAAPLLFLYFYSGIDKRLFPTMLPSLAAVPFFIIGLLDDRYAFRAAPKLGLQFLAAAIAVVGYGIKATVWLDAPWAGEIVSILWIVSVVNAYNMLDHADGLAAAVGIVAMTALGLGQTYWFIGGGPLVPWLAFITAGALAGFLVYNFPPAKLFMGDAGTMLVGFLLAALTIQGRYYYYEWHTPSRLVVLIPLAILAVPLFDMVCATVSRIRRRQSPFRGDATSHLAHRMLARGWSPRGIVAFAAAASAVCGGASVAMYFLSGAALAIPWLAVAAVLVAMLAVRRPPRAQVAQGSS
jgi:UDP-GlcNAc:undecaprenyl-phosphate GlcNAc-1-phosphate transferase